MDNEIRRKILSILLKNPTITQRDLSKKMGVSLGKVNYCLNSVIEKGLVKVNNFKNSGNKKSYSYILTSEGLEQKAKLTIDYIQRKMQEYESIRNELELLKEEEEYTKLVEKLRIPELLDYSNI